MDTQITCRIWAHENTGGYYHKCHAEQNGLAGQAHLRDEIEHKLRTTPIYIPRTGGIWKMLACEPNYHDGKGCEGCQYRHYKGLSKYYDLKQQREALLQAKRNGVDIRLIE
jgi:hypothetical protein